MLPSTVWTHVSSMWEVLKDQMRGVTINSFRGTPGETPRKLRGFPEVCVDTIARGVHGVSPLGFSRGLR